MITCIPQSKFFSESGWNYSERKWTHKHRGDYYWSLLRVTGDLNKLLGLDLGFIGSGPFWCGCCIQWTPWSCLINGGGLAGIITSTENEYRWRLSYSLITRIRKVADDQRVAVINIEPPCFLENRNNCGYLSGSVLFFMSVDILSTSETRLFLVFHNKIINFSPFR